VVCLLSVSTPALAQEVDCDPSSCPPQDVLDERVLVQFRAAAHCGKPDARAAFCAAADGWAKGTAAPLPVDKVFAGVKALVIGTSADDLTDDRKLDLQTLAVRDVRGKVTRIDISRPMDEWADDAIPRVLAVIAGKHTTAWALATSHLDLVLVRELASREAYKQGNGWIWQDNDNQIRYELRKVGTTWVALGAAIGANDWHSLSVFAAK